MIVLAKTCSNARVYFLSKVSFLILGTWSASATSPRGKQGHEHRNGVLASGVLDGLRLESVERDEGDATALVLDHDVQDLGRRFVVVDDDLEEAAKRVSSVPAGVSPDCSPRSGSDLHSSLVPVLDGEQLVKGTVVAVEVETLCDCLRSSKSIARVLVE